jgi:hypothetical protein
MARRRSGPRRRRYDSHVTNRRFTRLTNAFSKKVENHRHAIATNFAHYDFCRIHKTLRRWKRV